jgi:hypothetical protein
MRGEQRRQRAMLVVMDPLVTPLFRKTVTSAPSLSRSSGPGVTNRDEIRLRDESIGEAAEYLARRKRKRFGL